MLLSVERQRGVNLDQWLLRRPSRRAVLLPNMTHARMRRPLV